MACSSLTASARQATASQSCSQNWCRLSGWMPWSPCVQTYWSGQGWCHLPPHPPLHPEERAVDCPPWDELGIQQGLCSWEWCHQPATVKAFSDVSLCAFSCSKEQGEVRPVFQSNKRYRFKAGILPAPHLTSPDRMNIYSLIGPTSQPTINSFNRHCWVLKPRGDSRGEESDPALRSLHSVGDRRHIYKPLRQKRSNELQEGY